MNAKSCKKEGKWDEDYNKQYVVWIRYKLCMLRLNTITHKISLEEYRYLYIGMFLGFSLLLFLTSHLTN